MDIVQGIRLIKTEHMYDIGNIFQALIEGHVDSVRPKIPFYSSVFGTLIPDLQSTYWKQNLERPVLFYTAVRSILGSGLENQLFLELGPHSALAGPLKQIFKAHGSQASYIPSLVRNADCVRSTLVMAGHLHAHAVPIKFEMITSGKNVLTDLPTYPWHHDAEYWHESRTSREWRLRKFPHHDILGSRITEGNNLQPIWRNIIHLAEVPWIQDHRIFEDIVFPAAAYLTMAIEAIRQLTDTNDYFLRQVDIHKALVLHESRPAELVTSLHPVRSKLPSKPADAATNFAQRSSECIWYEFNISSFNGTTWENHCVGEIKAGSQQRMDMVQINTLSRAVSSTHWYQALENIGMVYGPKFQGLRDISVDPLAQVAVADISKVDDVSESSYPVHPTALDASFQLLTVAVSNGIPRRFNQVLLPVGFETLHLRRVSCPLRVQVSATQGSGRERLGNLIAIAANEPILELRGLRLSPIENAGTMQSYDTHAVAQLDWKPDLRFESMDNLIQPTSSKRKSRLICEKLALLCIVEASHQLDRHSTKSSHLAKFRSWLDSQRLRAEQGQYELIQDAQSLAHLSSDKRLALIDVIAQEAATTDAYALSEATLQVFQSVKDIYTEVTQPLDALLHNQNLIKLYDWLVGDWKEFLSLASHSKPTLRILEIGAGTGGSTAVVLDCLTSTTGEAMYSEYTFTDISSGFFPAAKERFKHAKGMRYAVLDISRDPMEQGFKVESYDLILAANVLHATPNIGQTLRNVRTLLHSHGRLLLQELSPAMRCINFVMGILPGWWLGEEDNRASEPYLSVERWDHELSAAGFSGADAAIPDDHRPYQLNFSIIATIPLPRRDFPKVTLLCHEPSTVVPAVETFLTNRGYHVSRSNLLLDPPHDQCVISLLDLDGPMLPSIGAEGFLALKRYIAKIKTGMLWVTRSIQMACENPDYGLVLGLARTARSELSVDFSTFEVDVTSIEAWTALLEILRTLELPDRHLDADTDFEYAFYDGAVYVGRYSWRSIPNDHAQTTANNDENSLESERIMNGKDSKVVKVSTEKISDTHLDEKVGDGQFRADASYLLVGGLGGLGQAIATWMIERGAKHLMFLSRNAGKSADDQAFLAEIESQGCSARAFAGSVLDRDVLAKVLATMVKPMKGVLQMSMVLQVCHLSAFLLPLLISIGPKLAADDPRGLEHRNLAQSAGHMGSTRGIRC